MRWIYVILFQKRWVLDGGNDERVDVSVFSPAFKDEEVPYPKKQKDDEARGGHV